MVSNSKLTREQKAARREMLNDLAEMGGVIASVAPVTVVLVRSGSHAAQMATAICSPEEVKFRRKVGEYHALTRFFDGVTVPVPNTGNCGETPEFQAGCLAENLAESAPVGAWWDADGNLK